MTASTETTTDTTTDTPPRPLAASPTWTPRPSGRSRRRATVLAAVGVLALLVLGACRLPGQSNAITGDNRPTTLAGFTNGKLPASQLVTLNSTCRVYKQAAGSLAALLVAANRAGVRLGTSECYRDYAGQVYQRKAWCARGICANAAIPGTSNHGWGKAVDLHDQHGAVSFTGSTFSWLMLNAGKYGFIHPNGVNEGWHWEWVGDGGRMRGAPVRKDLWSWPMRRGAVGSDVQSVQRALNASGAHLAVDGDFGPMTAGAVSFYQATHHLPVTGAVDLSTAMALRCFS